MQSQLASKSNSRRGIIKPEVWNAVNAETTMSVNTLCTLVNPTNVKTGKRKFFLQNTTNALNDYYFSAKQ